MIFLSVSYLSMSMCECSDEDDSAHLGSKKEAIFAEILWIGFATGFLPWSICIFKWKPVCKITGSKSSDYCAKSKCYLI